METLLQPAKVLAEWDSNFGQCLEIYFNSIKKAQSVNFGEAAMIVQNSTNVLVRRVIYLNEDVEALQKLFIQQEEEKKDENTTRKKKLKSKSVLDFNDFEPLKLNEYIGKSTDLKEGKQKTVKLLTRRFTQLESTLIQLSPPIPILNVEGEVIGNKYDFRCNQQLTKHCMLVDELLPSDFGQQLNATTPNQEFATDVTSGHAQDSGIGLTFEHSELTSTPASMSSEMEMETDVNMCVNKDLEQSCNIPNETDAGYTSGDFEDILDRPLTRSATKAKLTSITDNPDKDGLEPIPFNHGIPDTIPKRRTNFKLPCHVSLLKSRAKSRKRKTLSESKKQEYLTRFLLEKYECGNKKLKTWSPTGNPFASVEKEEFEECQKSFEQYLKNMQASKTNYEAIPKDVTMELMGFQPNFTKQDRLIASPSFVADKSLTNTDDLMKNTTLTAECDSNLSSVPESFTTPPPTPEAISHRVNYRELIEHRMRQIGEETREQSNLEQRVAEWHKSLRNVLAAERHRPPFHIHEYSSRIIKNLEVTDSKTLPFRNLVQQKSASEVARYFSASLQLANTYKVAINTSDSGCGIELKLLEQKRHHVSDLHEKMLSNDRTILRISTI